METKSPVIAGNKVGDVVYWNDGRAFAHTVLIVDERNRMVFRVSAVQAFELCNSRMAVALRRGRRIFRVQQLTDRLSQQAELEAFIKAQGCLRLTSDPIAIRVCGAKKQSYSDALRTLRVGERIGQHSEVEWQEVLLKFGNRCLCCGVYAFDTNLGKMTKDHITPTSVGGTDFITNIQPLCKPCNSRKWNRTMDFRGGQFASANQQ